MSVLSLLGFAQRAGRIVAGSTAVERALQRPGKVRLVIIAEDAAERTAGKFIAAAKQEGVPFKIAATKGELGSAIGRRDTAVLAICDSRFAKAVTQALSDS